MARQTAREIASNLVLSSRARPTESDWLDRYLLAQAQVWATLAQADEIERIRNRTMHRTYDV